VTVLCFSPFLFIKISRFLTLLHTTFLHFSLSSVVANYYGPRQQKPLLFESHQNFPYLESEKIWTLDPESCLLYVMYLYLILLFQFTAFSKACFPAHQVRNRHCRSKMFMVPRVTELHFLLFRLVDTEQLLSSTRLKISMVALMTSSVPTSSVTVS
jgi:hypothetical protein